MDAEALRVSVTPKVQLESVISLEADATLMIPSAELVLSDAVPSLISPKVVAPVQYHLIVNVPLSAIKTSSSVSILKCTNSPASAALALFENNKKTVNKTVKTAKITKTRPIAKLSEAV